MSVSSQWTMVRGSESICRVQGCAAEAAAGKRYCLRCGEEIRALEIWQHKQQARELLAEFRRQERRERLGRLRQWLRSVEWIAELVFVAGGLLYLGAVFAAAVLEWLR